MHREGFSSNSRRLEVGVVFAQRCFDCSHLGTIFPCAVASAIPEKLVKKVAAGRVADNTVPESSVTRTAESNVATVPENSVARVAHIAAST